MRTLFVALSLALLFLSCGSSKEKKSRSLTGNWLLLYPDHRLKNSAQRTIYKKYQDSLIGLYGLKLLQFSANGQFRQVDSILTQRGKWEIINDSLVKIIDGGKGFNPFATTFTNLTNDTLQLTQFVPLDDEDIKLVWFFKKIKDDDESGGLFTEKMNAWRRKPSAPETDEAIHRRLAHMLNFYGEYFKLVSREAIYFSQARVPLPFTYYQHGMGSKGEMQPAFIDLFYDTNDAAKAHSILSQAIHNSGSYPNGVNFGTEYGLFMKQMAKSISK